MIPILKVDPERLVARYKELERYSSHTRAIAKQLMSLVDSCDDCWKLVDPQKRVHQAFVRRFAQLNGDMEQLHAIIHEYVKGLKEALEQLKRDWYHMDNYDTLPLTYIE